MFLQWYTAQVSEYRDIDVESNEHIANLLQLVDEVDGDRVWLVNKQDVRRPAFITGNTQVVLSGVNHDGLDPFARRRACTQFVDLVRPGDLVIAHGILRANGDFMTTKIQVMGRAWGWGDAEDMGIATTAPVDYGFRYWGNVLNLDVDGRWCEVNTNHGRRRVMLSADCVVMLAGHTVPFSSLRTSDRVVFYATHDADRRIDSYRLVISVPGDRYPEADRSFAFDPNIRVDAGVAFVPGGPLIEGQVDYINEGPYFDKLALRVGAGGSNVVYVAKGLTVWRGGARISLLIHMAAIICASVTASSTGSTTHSGSKSSIGANRHKGALTSAGTADVSGFMT